jgi:hypothetical protein
MPPRSSGISVAGVPSRSPSFSQIDSNVEGLRQQGGFQGIPMEEPGLTGQQSLSDSIAQNSPINCTEDRVTSCQCQRQMPGFVL